MLEGMSTSTNPNYGQSAGPIRTAGAHTGNLQLPTPVKDETLQKAIQGYVNNLSAHDKAAFESAPDILEHIQDMQDNGKFLVSESLTSRVEKVLQCLKRFMGSLTIFIGHSPEISSLVVGGVNCILVLVLGYIEFFDRFTGMMENIGVHLSYLCEYSKPPYQESEKLKKALIAAYCDLLEFYVKARQVFINKKGKPSRLQGFKLFFRIAWEPFEAQFGSIEARFSIHTIAVVRLATIDFQNRALEHQKRQDEILKLEEDKKRKEVRKNILKWLSRSFDFEETHERHFRKRFGNTGQWLLDDSRFRNWKDGTRSSLLWCYGAPGSGKTILASLVIEHLSALYELSADTGITFIYCNYKEPRTTIDYIELALKQLCRTMQFLPPELEEVYERHDEKDTRPRYDELRHVFLAVIQQFGRIFFVLDALDECTPDQRKDLCDFFLNIANTASTGTSQGIVNIFIASRKASDIERAFQQKSIPTIEVEATKVDRDIAVYVQAQIELRLQDRSLRLRDMALKDKILNALTKKSDGMFLWVKFQLDAICAEISDHGIEKALKRLPEDMDATYERILNTVIEKPRAQRELARKILIWIAYAERQLSIDELVYAISIDTDTEGLEDLESSIPTEESILDSCANLISVDQGLVRFVHFSVQEFLTSHRSPTLTTLNIGFEVGNREIAQMCMIFLNLFPKRGDFLVRLSHLHQYAFTEWPQHLLAGNLNNLLVDDQLVAQALSFFENSPILTTVQQTRFRDWGIKNIYLQFSPPVLALIFNLPEKCWSLRGKQLEEEQADPFVDFDLDSVILFNDKLAIQYATAELDSIPVVQRLCNHGYTLNYSYPYDFSDKSNDLYLDPPEDFWESTDVQDRFYISPLFSVQNTQMAKCLLDNGISIEPQPLRNTFADPLKYFAQTGNWGVEVFQLLLDKVVDQDGQRYCNALQAAAFGGEIEVVQLLLGKGIDVNAQGGTYGNALQAAAYGGQLRIIQLLLDEGANINAQGGEFGNALQASISEGIEVTGLLLDKGADVNAQGGRHGNALQAAVSYGDVEVIRLLLDKGANVNSQDGRDNKALRLSVDEGRVNVIQLLLDEGANVNAEDGHVLHYAALYDNIEVTRLLLDQGANVNDQGGEYGNALQAAAYNGNIEVVRLLLDKGANVNAQGGEYGSALQAAAHTGKISVVRLLLDKGANVNAKGGEYDNALQAAVCNVRVKITRLLLEKGADVNAQSAIYGNALHIAAHNGVMQVIRFLLDKGANVNAQGGKYGNALQAAACNGKIEIIQLLLDKGANVNAQGGAYGNALQAAAYNGNIEVIQLLLDQGADINAQGGEHSNTLQAAAICNDIEVIQLLLDKGANVNAEAGVNGHVLQVAVGGNNTELVQLLLDKGANVNAQGGDYGNALQVATSCGKIEFVRLLLDKGANVNAQGGRYGNALQAAAYNHSIELIRLLLDKGANVNAQGGAYGNALQAAAYDGDMEVIQLLLDKGSNVNAQGGIFGDALQAAAYKGRIRVVRLLLDQGADVNTQGGMFGTVLQAAAHSGNIDLIQLLLDKGANVNARSGKYGAALREMLEMGSVGAGQRVPGDISLLVALLKDHAPSFLDHLLEPEYEDIAWNYLNQYRCSLSVFRELLESRGWKRGAQACKEEESGILDAEQELYKSECEDENKGTVEGENEGGTGTEDETPQELGQDLVGAPNKHSLAATVHLWKLFGLTFLAFLLYMFVGFFRV